MDRALQFHQIDFGQRRLDEGHPVVPPHHWGIAQKASQLMDRVKNVDWVKYTVPLVTIGSSFLVSVVSRLWHQTSSLGLSLMLHRS
jgi:hypothetical protein